jgi:hypothetical protein
VCVCVCVCVHVLMHVVEMGLLKNIHRILLTFSAVEYVKFHCENMSRDVKISFHGFYKDSTHNPLNILQSTLVRAQ